MKMTKPARFRFWSFGEAISRLTCARLSSPLWPAMNAPARLKSRWWIILAGAVNTAIVGSNGVLNRVAEDGVLTDWFRHPHRKLLVLRYKLPGERDWKVPMNFHLGSVEIPLGLAFITIFLFTLAIINLFTKETATIWGLGFTIAIFTLFEISEYWNKKKSHAQHPELEKFRLDTSSEISNDSVNARPGNILVAVRNPNQLDHVKQALEKTNTAKMDIVVLTVKKVSEAGSGEHGLETDQVFTDDTEKLFNNIVALAEKTGKHVELMVVPGTDGAGSARRSR